MRNFSPCQWSRQSAQVAKPCPTLRQTPIDLGQCPRWPPVPLMTPPLLRHQRRYGVSDPHLAAPRGCDTPLRLTLVNESEAPFSSREERIAFNEAWCRDLNERKADWMRSGLPTAGFRCECGQDELRFSAAALGIGVGGGPLATKPLCGGAGARRTRRGGGGQAVLRLLARREAGRGWRHRGGTQLTGPLRCRVQINRSGDELLPTDVSLTGFFGGKRVPAEESWPRTMRKPDGLSPGLYPKLQPSFAHNTGGDSRSCS